MVKINLEGVVMSEEDLKNNNKNIEKQTLDENLVEIMNRIKKERKLTNEEIARLENDAKQSLNFLKLIDEIKLPTDKYVVFTDGEEQLLYENGEFFVISSTDSTKLKKKKKRSEATNMYIEYFIRYVLNKMNKQKEMNNMVKEISEGNIVVPVKEEKTPTKDKAKVSKTKVKKENTKEGKTIEKKSEIKKDDIVR